MKKIIFAVITILLISSTSFAGASAPRTFHNLTGTIPLQYLDDDFTPLFNIQGAIDSQQYSTISLADAAAISAGVPLAITKNYSVSSSMTITSPVFFSNGGMLTISSNQTVTITSLYGTPGLQKIFSCSTVTCVSFSNGSIKSVYPEWWGAKADGATDSTIAIQSAINSTSPLVRLSHGIYIVTSSISMVNGSSLKGVGMGSGQPMDGVGGSFIKTSATGGALLVGSNCFNNRIEDLYIMSASTTTGRHGIVAAGTVAGGSSYGLHVNRVGFFRLDKAVMAYDSAGAHQWQMSQMAVEHCKFDECNIGLYCDSFNIEVRSAFNYINFFDKGIDLEYSSVALIDNSFGGSIGYTGLGAFIYVNTTVGNLNIRSSQAESGVYFLYVTNAVGDLIHPITMTGNIIDGAVSINAPRTINSIGNKYDGGNLTASDSIVTSIGDEFTAPYIIDRTVPMQLTVMSSTSTTQNKDTVPPIITPAGATTDLNTPLLKYYSPVWSSSGTAPDIGNGTLTGYYRLRGNYVTGTILFLPGSSTTFGTGNWTFTLPLPPHSGLIQVGPATIFDSVGNKTYVAAYQSSSGSLVNIVASGFAPFVGATIPHSWASGDSLVISFSYELD